MVRCLKNEKLARPVFYGAMVAEGIVALIWATAAITFTGGYPQLAEYMSSHTAGDLVHDLSVGWLGTFGGILAILGVVAAPITTGDTALRSARLIIADFLGINQSKITKRLIVTIPVFAATFALMLLDFNVLWRYFAWTNQTLAAFTLWSASVYLARHGKAFIICFLPACFMTMVVVGYLFAAPTPEGFGLPIDLALLTGAIAMLICASIFVRYIVLYRKGRLIHEVSY